MKVKHDDAIIYLLKRCLTLEAKVKVLESAVVAHAEKLSAMAGQYVLHRYLNPLKDIYSQSIVLPPLQFHQSRAAPNASTISLTLCCTLK